ncbi:MAG: chemotaxis protein CheB [Limisphaerales bacterium]
MIAAQEDERKSISHELQDEIAQTLVGINVRLLSLKQKARNNTKGFRDEISSTQRLVLDSAKSVRRFARQLDVHQPAQSNPSAKISRHAVATNSRLQPASVHRLKKPANVARKAISISPRSGSFPVIAMAASAGGLKALSVIMGGLPVDFPAAIAIVMHISPDHKSLLAEILNRRSHLSVREARSGDILCPSKVFVAPPNHHLLVAKGGRLELSSSDAEKVHFARPSAEPLFASVAKIYKKNAIAVVLTGGDGDGSFGVQIVKDKGGKVIAQDRPTSENFSMPETSIQTGDVDFILPLNEIAPKLIELVNAGNGLENGRKTANVGMDMPALEKFATPHYAAGTKNATIMRR